MKNHIVNLHLRLMCFNVYLHLSFNKSTQLICINMESIHTFNQNHYNVYRIKIITLRKFWNTNTRTKQVRHNRTFVKEKKINQL